MGKEGGNPAQWLNLMVSEPYYLFHFLCFFSYFVIRTSASQVLAPHIAHNLLRRVTLSLSLFPRLLCNLFLMLTFCSSMLLQEMLTLLVFALLVFIKVPRFRSFNICTHRVISFPSSATHSLLSILFFCPTLHPYD